jgi:hypothetical protein
VPWTTPITWTDGTVYGPTDLNEQIRDNVLHLKLSRANDGRVLGFTSAVFANLLGTDLTNVVDPEDSNTYSLAGDVSGGRIILPVFLLLPSSAGPGDLIVFGILHWRNESDAAWKAAVQALVQVGSPGIAGSIWIEGQEIHYIDDQNREQRLTPTTLVQTNSPGKKGSLWIEGNDLHYIDENRAERFVSGL